MSNLPINRHKVLATLADDIITGGVAIDPNDIERIVDIYERIIKTTSRVECDNTKTLYCKINPFDSIDFSVIEEEGIESLRQFVLSIDTMTNDATVEDGTVYHHMSLETVQALTVDDNIIAVLSYVQCFMHFLGAMAFQYIDQNKSNTLASFAFTSKGDVGTFELHATLLSDNTIAYTYYNTSLVNNVRV